MKSKFEYIIIGSGIIGLAIAKTINDNQPKASILIFDKETKEAFHASGRNSGVLHAGFYYSADSLKAQFTVEGNKAMRKYVKENNLSINPCGKLVVANNDIEVAQLHELERRGRKNGSNVKLIDKEEAEEIEQNVNTHLKALYSPDTASIDPKEVCQHLKHQLENKGVEFLFHTKYLSRKNNVIETNKGSFEGKKIINCAGLYADKIAKNFHFGQNYTIIPFKGLYLKYTKNKTDLKTNIYPVPNLNNPFLGVHFTITVDHSIKIGPTAIPAFWRENYKGLKNFKLLEFFEIAFQETKLFMTNDFQFRHLAIEEMKKYRKKHFVSLAQKMVKEIDPHGFTEFTKPGIRAQLLNTSNNQLLQDFHIEADHNSIHILNAVSPAFTCAFPFAHFIYEKYIKS